jgi:hypothetical protein
LLTPPSAFAAKYDWLPAVLESILLAIAQSQQPPVMSSLRAYQVLRGLFDASSQQPVSGIMEFSALGRLRDFLATGSSAPGVVSRIEEVAAATTLDERVSAIETWLTKVRGIAAEYLPASTRGAAPDGAFGAITTRAKAGKTPIFRDLAPDVYWATDTLIRLLHEAATTGHGAAAELADDAEQVVIPEGGTF